MYTVIFKREEGKMADDTVTGTNKPIVAAIDFGTTYSGYAYTFKTEYEKSPGAREIFDNRWSPATGAMMSTKAPTTALFDSDMSFHSFGYEAEEKYADLIQEKNHFDWHCFRRFKMKLCGKLTLNREFEIEDEAGRSFPAKTVFTESIKYLKKEVVKTLETRNPMNNKDAIFWVLTIPAIWTEPAKQFMREAAKEAGIEPEDMRIALEPEAAALYCRSLPDGPMIDADPVVKEAFMPGGTYMIVDLGGGTVDTTVHRVGQDGRLIEVRQASGGPWGGTSVDDSFYDFVVRKFGKDFIDKFKMERASDWMKLATEFETQKRKLKYDTTYNVRIQIPQRLIVESNIEVKNLTSYDKMAIENNDFKSFFQPSTTDIVAHMKGILSEVEEINLILLVGGYAQSDYVSGCIKKAFPDKKVVVPLKAEAAVMHGAVLFGFEPWSISARVCQYTYGIDCFEDFREGHHREDYRLSIDGAPACINLFSTLVSVGETIQIAEEKQRNYSSTHRGKDRKFMIMEVPVFASKDRSPEYTTEDSCVKLGTIKLEPPANGWPEEVQYTVHMFFGQTEFKVCVKNNVPGQQQEYNSTFDFLK